MGLDELGREPLTASMLACARLGKDLCDKESDRWDFHKSQAARALQGWRSLLKYLGQENKEGEILKRGGSTSRIGYYKPCTVFVVIQAPPQFNRHSIPNLIFKALH